MQQRPVGCTSVRPAALLLLLLLLQPAKATASRRLLGECHRGWVFFVFVFPLNVVVRLR